MRAIIHIGPGAGGAADIQALLDAKRDQLAAKKVLFPQSPGRRNHTRLFMSATDPGHVDPLRFQRGYGNERAQAILAEQCRLDLAAEIEQARPDLLILSAAQFAEALHQPSELERLRDFLAPFTDDIGILAFVEDPARMALRHYAEQLMNGRAMPLNQELALASSPDWWDAALALWSPPEPELNAFAEVHAPPFWLDFARLVAHWEAVFGAGAVTLAPAPTATTDDEALMALVTEAFGLPRIGRHSRHAPSPPPSAAWLARCRMMNEVIGTALRGGRIVPRPLWRRLLSQVEIAGAPIPAGSLHAVSAALATGNAALAARFPALDRALRPDAPAPDWQEEDPGFGFRATQYMAVFLPLIDQATRQERKKRAEMALAARPARTAAGSKAAAPATDGAGNAGAPPLSPSAERLLPPLARMNLARLRGGRFAPHDNAGRLNETEPAPPYTAIRRRVLPKGSSGIVIVACMKNEAPYIVEWIAYHRAMGIDNFLIYTNDCSDGTDEILDRMQELGLIQHRLNNEWKGKSPQQHALNKSLKEPLVRQSEWLAHIDVDEFINVRTANGTIREFLDAVPDATNVAMTWRLFGHGGVTEFVDAPVIGQFEACAPKYCPKPHTVWGFKTLFANNGAYHKLSCHRPNKLDEAMRDRVKWVNGSGQDMGEAIKDKGWRSEVKTMGYEMIQLNHYALRSAESFLVKRQRGRALHVDRTIGLNYWVRMDWSDSRDITIQRNLPRLKAEMDDLLADKRLRALHEAGVAWHRAKAAELRATPEFAELYQQALDTRLTALERVAYALALDMES